MYNLDEVARRKKELDPNLVDEIERYLLWKLNMRDLHGLALLTSKLIEGRHINIEIELSDRLLDHIIKADESSNIPKDIEDIAWLLIYLLRAGAESSLMRGEDMRAGIKMDSKVAPKRKILEILFESERPLSMKDIMERMELKPEKRSTLSKALAKLETFGFIERTDEGLFRLTVKGDEFARENFGRIKAKELLDVLLEEYKKEKIELENYIQKISLPLYFSSYTFPEERVVMIYED